MPRPQASPELQAQPEPQRLARPQAAQAVLESLPHAARQPWDAAAASLVKARLQPGDAQSQVRLAVGSRSLAPAVELRYSPVGVVAEQSCEGRESVSWLQPAPSELLQRDVVPLAVQPEPPVVVSWVAQPQPQGESRQEVLFLPQSLPAYAPESPSAHRQAWRPSTDQTSALSPQQSCSPCHPYDRRAHSRELYRLHRTRWSSSVSSFLRRQLQ